MTILDFDPWVFTEYDFDPWVFVEPPAPKDPENISGFRKSLVDRARKRVVHVLGGNQWIVEGSQKLGDAYPSYEVTYIINLKRYHCSCYDTQHGQTRARRVCSHVLAVILFRREKGGTNGSGPESGSGTSAPNSLAEPVDKAPSQAQLPMGQGRGVSVPSLAAFGNPPLPDFITEIRPHQWEAVEEAVEAFNAGADVVMIDAPTGAGKSLIGELVRRQLGARGLYTCTSLTLQDQFVGDYRYAKLLKGRGNYPTENFPFPEVTAGDCNKVKGDPESCLWCSHSALCPYERAKAEALAADLAVINTSYLLAEANHVGKLSGADLIVMDECDVLEKELMGYVEYRLSAARLDRLGLEAPKKGSHKSTIKTWLGGDLLPVLRDAFLKLRTYTDDVRKIRERNAVERLMNDTARLLVELTDDDDEEAGAWVRDYPGDKVALALKPTKVDRWGEDALWQHGKKFLLMSATIISGHELSESLGIEASDRRYHVVTVPMTFPVENRRIHVAPVANMAQRNKEEAWPQMARSIGAVLSRHPEERVLVHTVSYDLTRYLDNALRQAGAQRRVFTYRGASERASALEQFRRTPGAVLLAPSFDRGVDLAGDDCRVVVVAKVPFPYLGDRQVGARMKLPGGQEWYTVQTIRTLVQMTGRHVRSKDDWGVTYLLDQQFVKNIWGKHKHLLPAWWKEALDMNFPTKDLI